MNQATDRIRARADLARAHAALWVPAPCPARQLWRRSAPPGEPFLLPRVGTPDLPAYGPYRLSQLCLADPSISTVRLIHA